MPHWYIKAALQQTMSRLPDPQAANRLFQRFVTKQLVLEQPYFDKKLIVAQRHLSNWQRARGSDAPREVLELGTGWLPLVPIAMALQGCERVTTLDVQRLMTEADLTQTLRLFRESVSLRPGIYRPDADDRVAVALEAGADGIDAMLDAVGVTSVVGDAIATGFADSSFDFVTSNNTFEHIPLDVLKQILAEFRRVARPDAAMSHLVDLKDHYVSFDSSITPYNFLAFSHKQWAKFNNSLQYQNRARWPEYEALLSKAGWTVEFADLEGNEAQLARVDVHPMFASFTPAELAIHTAWVVSLNSAMRSDGSELPYLSNATAR